MKRQPPSTYAITALVEGERGAAFRVAQLTLLRAVPAGVGLLLVGRRESVVRDALAVSTAITATMIGYALLERKR